MISDDCKFYGGGFFKARLSFPIDYPLMPPKMKFETPIWHPNIYPDGNVCISILHPPEEDKYGYESVQERWLPIHTPESILLSVISMLSSPNDESPANVNAARQWREDPAAFKKQVRNWSTREISEFIARLSTRKPAPQFPSYFTKPPDPSLLFFMRVRCRYLYLSRSCTTLFLPDYLSKPFTPSSSSGVQMCFPIPPLFILLVFCV